MEATKAQHCGRHRDPKRECPRVQSISDVLNYFTMNIVNLTANQSFQRCFEHLNAML